MAAAESCQSSESPVDVDSSCSHDRVYCPNCLCELSCKDGPFVDTQQSGGDDTQGDVPEDDSGNSETDGRLFDKLKKRFTKSGKQSKKTDPNNSTLCAGCQKPVAWNSGDATVLPVDDTVERYTQHLAGSESAVGICSPSLAYVIHPKPRPHETPGVGGVATSTDDFLPKLFLLRWGAIVETYDAIPSILRETRRLTEAAVMTRGLASSAKHQCLYVADYNDNRIHRIDRTAAGRYVVVNWPVRGRPEGLSVNDAGNLLVACSGTNTVEEFTTYGHLINVVQPSWDIGSLWHAVELPASGGGRAFAVSHGDPGGPHGVSIIDGCGRIVRRYSDGSVGPVKHPRNVVVDRNGFVLVADSGNNRIVAFDPSLGDAKILPLPVPPPGGLQEPWALAYDETRGRLYVGEWSGRRVFAFSNVSDVSVLFRK